jgi:hypothetical protein
MTSCEQLCDKDKGCKAYFNVTTSRKRRQRRTSASTKCFIVTNSTSCSSCQGTSLELVEIYNETDMNCGFAGITISGCYIKSGMLK